MTTKALIISVGGSPNPIIHSINSHDPDYLIYFASAQSRVTVVENIEPALRVRPRDREFIMTPDEQDLHQSVSAIMKRLPEIMAMWKIGYGDLVADYTGGTKTMSSSLVLTLSGHIGDFSYVGGSERDKQGLGVVIDGREQMLYLKNPWEVLAVEAMSDMALLFNRCRFRSVMDLAERTALRAGSRRPFFDTLRTAAEGYYLWDNFQYKDALKRMKEAENKLRNLTTLGDDPLVAATRRFHGGLTENLATLADVVGDMDAVHQWEKGEAGSDMGVAMIIDLLANAVRRAEVEFKYDDAVSRIYSAVEKTAKTRLWSVYSIDNSAIDPEMIPSDALRETIVRECGNGREGKYQAPLHRSFEILEAFGDRLGRLYIERFEEVKKILNVRNNSLLAHGFAPIRKETYEKLLGIALEFVGRAKEDLPRFIDMKW